VLTLAGGESGRIARFFGGPGNSCEAGQGRALEDLADVVQRDD